MDEVAALLEPEIPGLRRYARALARDRDLADDLVQDCLERALSRWALRRSGPALRPWLFAILRNVFIDRVRSRRREPLDPAGDDLDGHVDPGIDPDSRLDLRDVLARLDALPSEQREVIVLVGVEDLTYGEAARVLGVPLGTVMSRLSRGRERLRRALLAGPVQRLRSVK